VAARRYVSSSAVRAFLTNDTIFGSGSAAGAVPLAREERAPLPPAVSAATDPCLQQKQSGLTSPTRESRHHRNRLATFLNILNI
jgi:hypothetical protein